jgi:hypothetical protein
MAFVAGRSTESLDRMKVVALAAVIICASASLLAQDQKCRGESDPSFSAAERVIIRAAREHAEKASGRIYTCFDFGARMKDGSRFLHLDNPMKRDQTSTITLGGHGAVLLDKKGSIIRYEGGR